MREEERRRALDRERSVALALHELIEALDRRVPHVERVGEIRIACEAAALRKKAVARIDELRTLRFDSERREDELSDAVMNDDGAPQPNA